MAAVRDLQAELAALRSQVRTARDLAGRGQLPLELEPAAAQPAARSKLALERECAALVSEIGSALRIDRSPQPGFARDAYERWGPDPHALLGELTADSARRSAREDELLRALDAHARTQREAVLSERATREEGERRLLRIAADVASALRTELEAENEARRALEGVVISALERAADGAAPSRSSAVRRGARTTPRPGPRLSEALRADPPGSGGEADGGGSSPAVSSRSDASASS